MGLYALPAKLLPPFHRFAYMRTTEKKRRVERNYSFENKNNSVRFRLNKTSQEINLSRLRATLSGSHRKWCRGTTVLLPV